jgi:hypothetical protein
MEEFWKATASLVRLAMGSWGATARLCLIILAIAIAFMLYAS